MGEASVRPELVEGQSLGIPPLSVRRLAALAAVRQGLGDSNPQKTYVGGWEGTFQFQSLAAGQAGGRATAQGGTKHA